MMMDKKKIIIACSIILVLIISVLCIYNHKHKEIQIHEADNKIVSSDVKKAFDLNGKSINDNDAKSITKQIDSATKNKPAKYEYYTTSDAQADTIAQEYAEKEKADALIKKQDKQEIKDKQGNTTNVYDNKYYAVSSEHKNRISVGVANVDNNAYATVAYTHDRVTAQVYSKDFRGIDGASVMYTVAKW